MGRPLPGVPVVLVDPATGQELSGSGEGEICLDLTRRPLALMTGRDEEFSPFGHEKIRSRRPALSGSSLWLTAYNGVGVFGGDRS